MAELLLGIDVGTYPLKGVLTDLEGTMLKTYVVEHKMKIPGSGWAEQDADAVWWHDVVMLCRALLDGSPYSRSDVAGVAVNTIAPVSCPSTVRDGRSEKAFSAGSTHGRVRRSNS